MSELHDRMDAEARRVAADPNALERALRRAERRRRTRRVLTGAVALAIAAASVGIAFAAFTPGGTTRPSAGPTPGPTPTSDSPSPPPLRIAVLNGTTLEGLEVATALRLQGEGFVIRSGGYRVVEVSREAEHESPRTLILCPPQYDDEAFLLREALFPGAEIRGPLPNDPAQVRIILGDDYLERGRPDVAAYELATEFMSARLAGQDAEASLSAEARTEFDEGAGGLSLYGYTAQPGVSYRFLALFPVEEGGSLFAARGHRVIVRITGPDGDRSEQFMIGPVTQGGTERLLVVHAELNEGPATAGPAFGEVQAFLSRFLEARSRGTGAERFLDGEATDAFSIGQGGLELYGYAADPGLVGVRTPSYDKLSVDRHRVVLRFHLTGPGGRTRTVWETLVLQWRGGEDFLVVEASGGRAATGV